MLRVMPIAVTLALIFAFILPAFIIYEPSESGETIGPKLLAVISLAAFGIAAALFRVFASWWRTRRLTTEWSENAMPIASLALPAFRLRHPFPVFAVVGVWRPRIYIAEQVLNCLDHRELRAVLAHELGHIASRDNLKSLAMKLCGDILVVSIGRSLNRHWAETSERAADDYAVEHGDRFTALSLASALIKIARLIPDEPLPQMPAASYFLDAGESLSIRIRRLVNMAGDDVPWTRPANRFVAPLSVLVLAGFILLAIDGRLLATVHDISEIVFAALQ